MAKCCSTLKSIKFTSQPEHIEYNEWDRLKNWQTFQKHPSCRWQFGDQFDIDIKNALNYSQEIVHDLHFSHLWLKQSSFQLRKMFFFKDSDQWLELHTNEPIWWLTSQQPLEIEWQRNKFWVETETLAWHESLNVYT